MERRLLWPYNYHPESVLCEECSHETLWIERCDMLDLFACTNELDGNIQIISNCESKTTLSRTIQFGDDDASQANVCGKLTRLQECVLTGCGIHDNQQFLWPLGKKFLNDFVDLL